jgi:flagellin
MSVINTNVKSLVAQNAMTVNNRSLTKAMEQLSTGKRINSAADDAAGMAITERMTSQIKGLNQAVKNGNDAISMLQTAEGSMIEVNSMLQRMRELSVSASTATNGQSERNYMDQEFQELKSEISRVTKTTSWNGMAVLNGGDVVGGTSVASKTQSFHVGASANNDEKISVDMKRLSTLSAGGTTITNPAEPTTLNIVGSTTPAVTAQAQVNTLSIAGAVVGDSIDLNINGTAVSYTVTSTVLADQVDGLVAEITKALGDAVPAVEVTAAKTTNAGEFTLTADSAGDAFTVEASAGKALQVIGDTNDTKLTNILSANSAKFNIGTIDNSLTEVNKERAKLGAAINRLTHTVDNLTNVSQNTSESRSRIQDTDYATATTELARTQIISQAATAMLAQANQASQSVLSLLK